EESAASHGLMIVTSLQKLHDYMVYSAQSFRRHSRMPPEKPAWSSASTRSAEVVRAGKETRFHWSLVGAGMEVSTGFQYVPSRYSNRQDFGMRHWPVPVSSNQYTSTAEIDFAFGRSYCTHSVVPR